ncbi:hypothetical protein [Listeria booriae]|uniref:Uncharacterized protein n=1 Tax=Listeria booriae TaxID=1552123 RepID=A0A841ZZG4_9LIST|nr:hypothetical protein [Listeria booriae]MBC1566129.1 hypothetical protein [Listeria booriae]
MEYIDMAYGSVTVMLLMSKKFKHQGEVDFDFNNQKPADKSGKHDIRVK